MCAVIVICSWVARPRLTCSGACEMTNPTRTTMGKDSLWDCAQCGASYYAFDLARDCCVVELEPDRSRIGAKLTGGSSSHYVLDVTKPLEGQPYRTQCLDIITSLNMTFAEGEAFKAIWRKAAARLGNGKPGNTALYDAEKVKFYGETMVRLEGE